MRKSFIAALFGLLVILSPAWLFSETAPDKADNLEMGYVEVEDIVWKKAEGKPEHPQRGLFYVYVPITRGILAPQESGAVARYEIPAGRYQAVAYSSRARFDVGITLRDHSPFHAGVVSNTYYLELFSFEVDPKKVTVIQGYIGPYRTENLRDRDQRNSGGYTAYWEPRVDNIAKQAMTKGESF
jgi:hypothetical protein